MRDLSEDRQRLEARLYATILRWNTLRARGLTGDPHLTVRAVETANSFWADPTSLVSDREVADALAAIEASIADLETRGGAKKPLRTLLLRALREMSYWQDETNVIMRFDVPGFAQENAVSAQQVVRRLRDLLDEGLVEPYYPTQGEGPMQGAVRITTAGRLELRGLGDGEE